MENSNFFAIEKELKLDEGYQKTYKNVDELLPTLPRSKGWWLDQLLQYQGFWLSTYGIRGSMLIDDHFNPRPTDLIVATSPKCGTTWLRALVFSIINRNSFDFSDHPLRKANPRDLVHFLEAHIPCRFVYICRDPKDVLVSKWHFANKLRPKGVPPLSLEEAFDLFSKGVSHYGPFWDHVLGYWKASLESPKKVLCLKYEDVKKEPLGCVRKVANFLGVPFTPEEENKEIVEEIVKLCSFEHMSSQDVNKSDTRSQEKPISNSDFFRKGEAGDWVNHLSPQMSEILDQITEQKFQGTGFSFH
ncbi:hypothetical protein Godav_020693 [Gossypium davidsonii]|uniref:Sulfotransferase n=1 Tax=Gossypium davidsonii TaxID=34287 RepID=A0A7J8R3Q0_GOSDV|nr:hypothetical protein [Gossypium davidsonii]